MISIIICSRTTDILHTLKENISVTIGVEYELVLIDNSTNKYSIFEAYNKGVRQSKYPYLCFMHEDISFHTYNWGQKVISHFDNENVGMIGAIGGHLIADYPSTWCCSNLVSGNYIQGYKNDEGTYYTSSVVNDKYLQKGITDVVAVDGFWFCVKKNLFPNISFDETTFNSFHAYDIDIAMQINLLGNRVCVIDDILIEHFSAGTPGDKWIVAMMLFQKKWKSFLPLHKGLILAEDELLAIRLKLQKIYKSRVRKVIIRKAIKNIFGKF